MRESMIRILMFLATISLMTMIAHPSRAELLRVELGTPQRATVPTTFSALEAAIARAGMTTGYVSAPYYDPYFSHSGGATNAYISADIEPGVTVQFTWTQFDSPAAAMRYETELQMSYGASTYMVWARAGDVVLQVYGYSYAEEDARRAMDLVLGR